MLWDDLMKALSKSFKLIADLSLKVVSCQQVPILYPVLEVELNVFPTGAQLYFLASRRQHTESEDL